MPEEKQPKPLTLCAGAKVVAFKEMTTADMMKVREEQNRQPRLLLAEFPDLADAKGEAFNNHPDLPRYTAQRETRVLHWPWLHGADASAESITLDDLKISTDSEVVACLVAVGRLHMHRLLEMPDVVDMAMTVERNRPN